MTMRYPKELSHPIARPKESDDETVRHDFSRKIDRKMQLLFQFFKIEEGDWPQMANTLARRHLPAFEHLEIKAGHHEQLARLLAHTYVPGLQLSDRAGRPTKWTTEERRSLFFHVEYLVHEHQELSFAEVLRKVQRSPAWAKKTKGLTDSAMRKLFDTSKALVKKEEAAFNLAIEEGLKMLGTYPQPAQQEK